MSLFVLDLEFLLLNPTVCIGRVDFPVFDLVLRLAFVAVRIHLDNAPVLADGVRRLTVLDAAVRVGLADPVCGEFQICRIDPSGFQVLSRMC